MSTVSRGVIIANYAFPESKSLHNRSYQPLGGRVVGDRRDSTVKALQRMRTIVLTVLPIYHFPLFQEKINMRQFRLYLKTVTYMILPLSLPTKKLKASDPAEEISMDSNRDTWTGRRSLAQEHLRESHTYLQKESDPCKALWIKDLCIDRQESNLCKALWLLTLRGFEYRGYPLLRCKKIDLYALPPKHTTEKKSKKPIYNIMGTNHFNLIGGSYGIIF